MPIAPCVRSWRTGEHEHEMALVMGRSCCLAAVRGASAAAFPRPGQQAPAPMHTPDGRVPDAAVQVGMQLDLGQPAAKCQLCLAVQLCCCCPARCCRPARCCPVLSRTLGRHGLQLAATGCSICSREGVPLRAFQRCGGLPGCVSCRVNAWRCSGSSGRSRDYALQGSNDGE